MHSSKAGPYTWAWLHWLTDSPHPTTIVILKICIAGQYTQVRPQWASSTCVVLTETKRQHTWTHWNVCNKGLQTESSQPPTLKWPVNMHQIIRTAFIHNFVGFQKKSLGLLWMAEMCSISWWYLVCQSAGTQETKWQGGPHELLQSIRLDALLSCWKWSGPSQQCKLHHAANTAIFCVPT